MLITSFIIRLAPCAGKINRIQHPCDWLPEWARWSSLSRPGLPAVSRKKNNPESHIINPLLTKLFQAGYWPRSFFCEFMDLDFVSVHFWRFLCVCTQARIKGRNMNCIEQSASTTKVSIPSVSVFISAYRHPTITSRTRRILTDNFSMSLYMKSSPILFRGKLKVFHNVFLVYIHSLIYCLCIYSCGFR